MLTLKKLRVFHLLLALAAIAAYFTGEAGGVHRLIGYSVAALLVVRLIVSLFAAGPFGWRRWIPAMHAPASMGGMKHPAISRFLILAIFACAIGTATTGVLMDQGRALANPDFSLRGEEESEEGYGEGYGEEGEGDEEEGPLSDIHELLANLLLPLVGLHVAYLVLFRRPLAKFMLFVPAPKHGG